MEINHQTSKLKKFLFKDLPQKIAEIRSKTLNEVDSDDLEGWGFEKIIIRSNIIDIYTRLEVLLGL